MLYRMSLKEIHNRMFLGANRFDYLASEDKKKDPPYYYSILFFPSSAFVYRIVLRVLSCLATRLPITLSFRTLLIASW